MQTGAARGMCRAMTTDSPDKRRCSYCGRWKPTAEFNLEHIWPDALGGDALPQPWLTNKVCARCNELSGRFVDGEFIKSWFISHERSNAAREYLDVARPQQNWLPLSYMGVLPHPELRDDEVAEVWLGPCGDHIVHVRPKQEPIWDVYAGGKPTRKRSDWGSAFMSLCSEELFWIWTAVNSFHRHFRRADRFVLNMNMPQGFTPPFGELNDADPEHARLKRIARSMETTRRDGQMVGLKAAMRLDLSGRFLTKVALGIGREVLGEAFLDTTYAAHLRAALWERDLEKRGAIPVRGTGFFGEVEDMPGMSFLRWPGAWVLWLNVVGGKLALIAVTPSGKSMVIQISDEHDLVDQWARATPEGLIFISAAAIAEAAGPLEGAEFIAHQLGNYVNPELDRLAKLRRGEQGLPACR